MKNSKSPVVSGAPIAMHELGKATDSLVTKEIIDKPGSTISEIAETLGCSNGKVDGSINRLSHRKEIVVKHFLQRGTLIKKAYPKNYIEKPKDIVEIPKNMLTGNEWKKNAFVYALSRSTIGLSPTKNDEWDKKSLLNDNINIKKRAGTFVITLPEKLSSFYELENSETSLSTIDDLALVTVESVLPVALPSSYPEKNKPLLTYTIEVDRELLGCASQNEIIYLHEKTKKTLNLFSCFPYVGLTSKESQIISVSSAIAEPCRENMTLPLVSK